MQASVFRMVIDDEILGDLFSEDDSGELIEVHVSQQWIA
jgi:hypothetical protein